MHYFTYLCVGIGVSSLSLFAPTLVHGIGYTGLFMAFATFLIPDKEIMSRFIPHTKTSLPYLLKPVSQVQVFIFDMLCLCSVHALFLENCRTICMGSG
jgi:hypothetical protein